MTNDLHERILDLIPAYALGCLDEEEMILVSEYLIDSPEYQAELHAIQTVTDQLALAGPSVEPPAELKQRLMARVQSVSPAVIANPKLSGWQKLISYVRHPGNAPYWQVAMVLLIFVLAASNLLLWQQVSHLKVTTNPTKMQAIPLAGTGLFPGANGFITISADGLSGAIIVDQLPMLGDDQQYQLWLIKDGERTSGALFSVDERSYGGTRVRPPKSLFEYTEVEVTIEPANGSPAPTSDAVLAGPLFNP